uniref:Uncharacterized protein n=1 Tax=Anopheles culicifacies TaxID=139723 RepID=A0A182MKU4_9DIPT
MEQQVASKRSTQKVAPKLQPRTLVGGGGGGGVSFVIRCVRQLGGRSSVAECLVILSAPDFINCGLPLAQLQLATKIVSSSQPMTAPDNAKQLQTILPNIRLVPEPVMKDAAKINPQTINFHFAAMEYLMVTGNRWPYC